MKQDRTSSLEWLMVKLANYDHTWMTFAAVEALSEEDRKFLGPEMELLVREFSGFPDENCYFSGMWGGWSGLPEEGRYPDYRREWDISRLIGYDPVTGKGRRLYHAAPDVYTAVRTFFPRAVEAFRAGRRLEGNILLGFVAHYLEDEATFPLMQALHRGHHFDYSRINVSGYRPVILEKNPADAAAGLERRVKEISDLTMRRNLSLRKAINENDIESYEAIYLECCEEASRVLADALRTAAFLSRDRRVPGDNPCGVNLIANPSFEKGDGSFCPAGWVIGWLDIQDRVGRADWLKRTTRNSRENHTGTGSVSLTFAPAKGIEWRQRWLEAVPVKPGERYFLSGWIRTHRATGDSYFALECYEGNHTPVSRHKSVSVDGSATWRQIGLEVTIPAGAEKARVICRSENNEGIVWFDDVELVRLDAGTRTEGGVIGHDTVILHLNGIGKGYEIPDRSNYHELNGPIITCSGKDLSDLHSREKTRHYLSFDGKDDFLEMPYSRVEDVLNPPEGLRIEMEFFVDGAQDACILSKEVSGRGYRLALDRSGLTTFTVFSPGKGISVTAPCPVGKWVRLEISAKSGEKLAFYVDGQKVAESAEPIPALNAAEADFYLASKRGISGFFRGRIKEVKISRFLPE